MLVAFCPVKPHGVVSSSQPHLRTMSQFSTTSFRTFSWGAIMPWKPWPHTCLEPQYQPSQLSGWRTCRVKPPISSSRRALWPCGVWMVLLSPWPSPWTRIAAGPYCLWIRAISLAMMSVASSQEMRTYLLLPRFCGFLSPSGSQSMRLSGYLTRLGEYVRFL